MVSFDFSPIVKPPVVASLSHVGGDEEMLNSIVGIEVGGMVNAPSS